MYGGAGGAAILLPDDSEVGRRSSSRRTNRAVRSHVHGIACTRRAGEHSPTMRYVIVKHGAARPPARRAGVR